MSMAFSFSDDVGQLIDDKRFDRQFQTSKRGLFNHAVNPFARTNLINEAVTYRQMFPSQDAAPAPNDFETKCCNNPTSVIIGGKKSEDAPLENASLFWNDIRTPHCCRPPKTTQKIGLDDTEN